MRVLLVAAICLGASPLLGAQDGKGRIPRHLVEKFQKLSPEQKARLRERLAELKKLGPEERRRLLENLERFRRLPETRKAELRERFEKLGGEEKRRMAELATGFNHWSRNRFPALERFPRGAFFRWAAQKHPERLEGLKSADEAGRRAGFLELSEEFKGHQLQELRRHALVHKCVPAADVEALAGKPLPEFWPAAEALSARCPKRRPAGGPVRPPKPH